MEKHILAWAIITVMVLLLLPWLVTSFIPADSGMAAMILLLLIVNPLCAAATGIFSGQSIKSRWSLPVIFALLFSCGAWFLLQMYAAALFAYTGIYLAVGIAAMLLTAQINRLKIAKDSLE